MVTPVWQIGDIAVDKSGYYGVIEETKYEMFEETSAVYFTRFGDPIGNWISPARLRKPIFESQTLSPEGMLIELQKPSE